MDPGAASGIGGTDTKREYDEANVPGASAGEITRFSSIGVIRSGSRKKYAHQSVRITPIQPSGSAIRNKPTVIAAKIATNFQPSGLIGTRTDFKVLIPWLPWLGISIGTLGTVRALP